MDPQRQEAAKSSLDPQRQDAAPRVDTDAQVLEKSQRRVPEPVVECVMEQRSANALNDVPVVIPCLVEPARTLDDEHAREMDSARVSVIEIQTMVTSVVPDTAPREVQASEVHMMDAPEYIDENDLTTVGISYASVSVTLNPPQWLPENADDRNSEDKYGLSRIEYYGDIKLPWEMSAHSSGINTILYEHWRSKWKEYGLSSDLKSAMITLESRLFHMYLAID